MPQLPEKASTEQSLDYARAAFRLLVTRRVVPTPEAYRLAYEEVSGTPQKTSAESLLTTFGVRCQSAHPALAVIGANICRAVAARDWASCDEYFTTLHGFLARYEEPDAHAGERGVFKAFPTAAERQADLLRGLLSRTLGVALASLLRDAPALAKEANVLGNVIRDSTSHTTLEDATARLRQLCFKIELYGGDNTEQQALLLRLFGLLLDNIGELIDDDVWMRGQIAMIRTLLSGTISHRVLDDAARNLKEIIYKQSVLKQGIAEARTTVKKTMLTFIDQLDTIVTSSSELSSKMDTYSAQISKAHDIVAINEVLSKLMQATRASQIDAAKSRDQMQRARRELQDAEARVQKIEVQLSQLSERTHQDPLTGSLNRRGLDDMLKREIERAEKRKLPVCLALLAIDELLPEAFASDPATAEKILVHLVQVASETLRSMDIVGRLEGREFLIVLPDTNIGNAGMILTRLQRRLTERFFMHEETRLFITFCAGIVLRGQGEDSNATIRRAAEALALAKRAGKNHIIVGKSLSEN